MNGYILLSIVYIILVTVAWLEPVVRAEMMMRNVWITILNHILLVIPAAAIAGVLGQMM